MFSSFALTGAKEVDEEDDMFILVAPQNAVGNCIIDVRILRVIVLLCCSTILPLDTLVSNLAPKFAGFKSNDGCCWETSSYTHKS